MGLKFIDLFAGIGGFRLGMEMAGHKAVGWCEIDKHAQKSYRAIHDCEGEWFADDIRTVDPDRMPEFDCLCGGFPCQAFSVAGKRQGFRDTTRGTLFFEIARIAERRKPKYLFLENVKGLLNHDNGSTFETILRTLDELGYDAEWQCINSKHFGIPQNRERVFIVGHLRGRCTRKVFPIIGTNGETLKECIGGRQGYRVYDPSGTSVTLASQAGGMGAKTGLYLVNKNKNKLTFRNDFNCLDANYHKGLHAHQARTGVLEVKPVLTPDRLSKRQNGRRMKNPGEEMFTLTAQDRHGIYDGVRIRRLTPKECWRLQGFPDWAFEKAAKVNSDTQLYKQAGNSVTVNVIYEIAKRLE